MYDLAGIVRCERTNRGWEIIFADAFEFGARGQRLTRIGGATLVEAFSCFAWLVDEQTRCPTKMDPAGPPLAAMRMAAFDAVDEKYIEIGAPLGIYWLRREPRLVDPGHLIVAHGREHAWLLGIGWRQPHEIDELVDVVMLPAGIELDEAPDDYCLSDDLLVACGATRFDRFRLRIGRDSPRIVLDRWLGGW